MTTISTPLHTNGKAASSNSCQCPLARGYQGHTCSWTSWVCCLLLRGRPHTMGSHGADQNERVLGERIHRTWVCVLWFGGRLKKQGFAVRKWGNPDWISWVLPTGKTDQSKTEVVIGKEAAVAHYLGFGVFSGLANVRALSVFRCDYRVAMCLSCSITVTDWPCLMSVFRTVTDAHRRSPSLAVSARPAPEYRGCSCLSQSSPLWTAPLHVFASLIKASTCFLAHPLPAPLAPVGT